MERKRLFFAIIIIALTIVILAPVLYIFQFSATECYNFICFQDRMRQCKPAQFLNEEPEATWKYYILGKSDNKCEIEVTLLRAKEGELDIHKLEGLSMLCEYPLNFASYPEKDLSKCHGRLKEELQSRIIEKLHSIILENIENFNTELNTF
jgi:hypothetical protein